MNKELFYIAMAALGGYAAWLSIKQNSAAVISQEQFLAGAFYGGIYDFYGNAQPFDDINYLVNLDNQQPTGLLSMLGF